MVLASGCALGRVPRPRRTDGRDGSYLSYWGNRVVLNSFVITMLTNIMQVELGSSLYGFSNLYYRAVMTLQCHPWPGRCSVQSL